MQTIRSSQAISPSAHGISDEVVQNILAAVQRLPLSMNAEYISVVVVRDAALRARIGQATFGYQCIATLPVFVCIIIDFAKAAAIMRSVTEAEMVFESTDGFAASAVDAGMVLSALIANCHQLGFNTVRVDGVRLNPKAMIELLGLPPMTFPAAGCCIGTEVPQATPRPLLPLHTFIHTERWQRAPLEAEINVYNDQLCEYLDQSSYQISSSAHFE